MVKSIIVLIVATVLVVIFRDPLVHVLNFLLLAHHRLATWLGMIFSGGSIGRIIQGVIALVIIPGVIGGIVAGGYHLIKKEHFKYTVNLIWIIWLILLVTMLAQSAMSSAGGHTFAQSTAQSTPQTTIQPAYQQQYQQYQG